MLLASSPVAVVTSGSALTTGSNVTLDDLYVLLASINGLLVRINEYFDYIVAFAGYEECVACICLLFCLCLVCGCVSGICSKAGM